MLNIIEGGGGVVDKVSSRFVARSPHMLLRKARSFNEADDYLYFTSISTATAGGSARRRD
ncbi:hypothetical protein E2C01_042438 [Portunus trituberculatus]|uniref:Uncharacterized protein n=1 Tax=Portunus trituberculatus TaxID=210409 RepID=A0A5B7FTG3_PORTR|nr:hypothetical protein [Portunus trituberculatus]